MLYRQYSECFEHPTADFLKDPGSFPITGQYFASRSVQPGSVLTRIYLGTSTVMWVATIRFLIGDGPVWSPIDISAKDWKAISLSQAQEFSQALEWAIEEAKRMNVWRQAVNPPEDTV